MGSTSSKFKKYLQHGDEFAAMQIYQNSPELRKHLDPNLSYGENHNHNTALHYAAKHGMKHLLRTFLNDLSGNPNKKNGLNETVLHCACQMNQTKSFSAQERRAACVQFLLHWKGVHLKEGGREKVDLGAQDKEGNTALHCAASAGLKRCVELLVTHGAPLFIENNDRSTPCDMAMRNSYHDIARLLESKMVFADSTDTVNEEDRLNGQEEVYSGLRSQDLQEAKDQLLVDTSDMLKIPLFTAEALLRNNEWSRELLLEKWMKDPIECCQLSGVQAPTSILKQRTTYESSTSPDSGDDIDMQSDAMCEICVTSLNGKERPIMMSCKHAFCKHCWENYLTIKIQDGDAHHIMCPAYQCHILVPVELIERLVSPDMARRYLQFDIKAFVESNKSIKWCPVAGCGRAVRLPETEQRVAKTANKCAPITSHAVDCGNAHFFCWECLGAAHAPCGCKQWLEWQGKITEIKPEELKASCTESENAANCLWLVTNAKPCPNCQSPIQKNEGCNHMKCSKCKFDFCWVCQESWKKHSSATGGYFRCNRFEAVNKADEKQDNLITEALDKNNQMQEISRFLHYYTRFKNHENSQKLEEPLLTTARQKMEILASSLGLKWDQDLCEKGTKFVEDGVKELLKARRVLCGSYVYGYYLEDDGYSKSIFEFMQNELEEVTEKLSEMIARPYLRTPKTVIVQTTSLARRKRHEFVRAVAQGLIPPETPPQRRNRKRRLDFTDASAWLKGCEWDEMDSDEETDVFGSLSHSKGSPVAKEHQCDIHCTKHNCGRFGLGSDYNMELVIALEMSRLQMIEDRIKQQASAITPDPSSSVSNNSSESTDEQLKLAIQLSLQESKGDTVEKSSADITVDNFLKSLANQSIDLKNLASFDMICDGEPGFFKQCNGNEDGRFQISDIHESGFAFPDEDDFPDDIRLKRSHSTGDLCVRRPGRGIQIRNIDEPRYHLDSDHSIQHDEKPEDAAKKIFVFPSSGMRSKHYLVLHQSHPEETGGHSSLEDTTTTSDSLEVGVLESIIDEDTESPLEEDVTFRGDLKKTEDISKTEESKRHNPFASLKAKLCSAHLPRTAYLTRIAVNKSIGLLSDKTKKEEEHDEPRRHSENSVMFKQKFSLSRKRNRTNEPTVSKSTSFLVDPLHIHINPEKALETDSSNEYESETGIPKSPTLFISGVSISRTPEPKSPGLHRQSRSSSVCVPTPLLQDTLSISTASLNATLSPETFSPSLAPSSPSSSRGHLEASPKASPNAKSKSASEPERDKEVFRFPKSSTDGALSSVLHVQESNLSSDDFHEALFLLERSPKAKDSKRRKRSKKKDKEERKEEVSSAL